MPMYSLPFNLACLLEVFKKCSNICKSPHIPGCVTSAILVMVPFVERKSCCGVARNVSTLSSGDIYEGE